MKSIQTGLFAISLLAFSLPSEAQYAADAFRFSEINQTGTARFQGVGGNHAALGGDASAISGNPAGLGFYNRSELSLSPSFNSINTSSTYLGRVTTDGKINPNLAQASLVIAGSPNNYNRKWRRSSLGVSFTRQQSFQNLFTYAGRNNRSAYVDAIVEQANQSNISAEAIDQDYDPNNQTAFTPEAAYYQLYLINPSTAVGPPYFRYDRENPTDQTGSFESTGAHSQWNFAYAGNYDDRIYVGASIGFSRIRYNYSHALTDTYVNSTIVRSSVYNEDLNVTGNGINASFGIIYKASPELQLGATITSPTFMSISETFAQDVSADIIGIPQQGPNGQPVFFVPDLTQIGVQPNDFEYTITSPLRASGGVTYFFNQKGFLTGTVEYVGYGGMRVSTNTLNATDNSAFRNENRQEIQDTFTSGINLRLGGEVRAGVFRVRAGAAYIGDPYRIRFDDINRTKLLFSGGVGYRSDRFFVDATAIYNSFKSAFTPYVLNNQNDYGSVDITNQSVNALFTLGTFF